MPSRTVTIVEINVYEGLVPLVSGYLEAYACTDPEIARDTVFDKRAYSRNQSADEIYDDLSGSTSDVYAFSCYIWNMRLVKALVARLKLDHAAAWFVLGGPQVMGHMTEYVADTEERIIVCNAEGEIPFARLLQEFTNARPKLEDVPGVSFYRDRLLVTTPPAPRLKDLDEIPSPYLAGIYNGSYSGAVLETNRGCPFHCGFCFWGAATNDKVHRFSDERVREDIAWMSRHDTPFIFIADANWGMLKRDIELSQHIVDCKNAHGSPAYVYFSAAKNSPDRVADITQIFKGAGLFSSQPISMQSVDERTLELIDRKNIKLEAYESLQENLNARDVGSFIELIWPLPGETLKSFEQGIETLCSKGANCLIVYPHLLLHNTPIFEQRDAFGVVTRTVEDEAAEAEIVVATADVTEAEFEEGMWFIYTVLGMHNAQSLPTLARHLHDTGRQSYGEFYSAFTLFCMANNGNAITDFCRDSIDKARFYDVFNYPTLYLYLFHEHRAAFDELLTAFVRSQAWWDDDVARCLAEFDLLSRPYIYSNTRFTPLAEPLEEIAVIDSSDRTHLVELTDSQCTALRRYRTDIDDARLLQIDHTRSHIPYRASQPIKTHADYCSGAIMRISSLRGKPGPVALEL